MLVVRAKGCVGSGRAMLASRQGKRGTSSPVAASYHGQKYPSMRRAPPGLLGIRTLALPILAAPAGVRLRTRWPLGAVLPWCRGRLFNPSDGPAIMPRAWRQQVCLPGASVTLIRYGKI